MAELENELSAFRAEWQEEIETTKYKNVEEQSFDLFRQALYYEREGQPFEAVRYYRQAFRLNPQLEYSRQAQLDADFLSPDEVHKTAANPYQESKSREPHDTLANTKESIRYIPQWAEHFAGSLCERVKPDDQEEEMEDHSLHVGQLPPEIIAHIFKFLPAQWLESCSSVCRCWYVISRENDIWKNLCVQQWPEDYEMLVEQVQEQLFGNWRRLFIDKPRPRLDGVYISQNSYIRSGQTEGSYDQPVFKIRYWRYIRFFADGSASLICSPQPPKKIVPQLRKDCMSLSNGKEIIDKGTYKIMDENLISESKIFIESTKQNSRGPFIPLYCYVLRLANSYRGWHDRLLVEDYYMEKENIKNSFRDNFIRTYKFVHVPKHVFIGEGAD